MQSSFASISENKKCHAYRHRLLYKSNADLISIFNAISVQLGPSKCAAVWSPSLVQGLVLNSAITLLCGEIHRSIHGG